MEVGTYTIVGPKGGHRTIEIQKGWTPKHEADGTLVARFLRGPDNETDFTGFAFVNSDNSIRVWSRFQHGYEDMKAALKFLVTHQEQVGEFGKQYALKSNRCYCCQRKLTVPVSVFNGLGKTCARNRGIVRVKTPKVPA